MKYLHQCFGIFLNGIYGNSFAKNIEYVSLDIAVLYTKDWIINSVLIQSVCLSCVFSSEITVLFNITLTLIGTVITVLWQGLFPDQWHFYLDDQPMPVILFLSPRNIHLWCLCKFFCLSKHQTWDPSLHCYSEECYRHTPPPHFLLSILLFHFVLKIFFLSPKHSLSGVGSLFFSLSSCCGCIINPASHSVEGQVRWKLTTCSYFAILHTAT